MTAFGQADGEKMAAFGQTDGEKMAAFGQADGEEMTAFEQAEQYIQSIPRFAGKHSLADTEALLNELCLKKTKSRVIHVAGTNGKGSVCAYLRSILLQAGFRVGLFTSPHLEDIRERICIGNQMVSKEEFAALFKRVKAAADAQPGGEAEHPSFFEFLFLMAMVCFNDREVDYIILETGMGGRLDATNVIKNPAVCVITSIGYDHMQYLGDTLPKIAAEKAGIIKPKAPVVFMEKQSEIRKVLEEYAEKEGSSAVIIKKTDISNVNIGNKSIDFSFHSGYYNYVGLSLNTIALYQTENAALAVKAAELLKEDKITSECIRNGLFMSRWPGRMEEAAPDVYIDGAHNEDGMAAFLNTVKADGCKGRRFLLFGAVSDKRYDLMLGMIKAAGVFEKAAIAVLQSDRSVPFDKLRQTWGQYNQIECTFFEDAGQAYENLLKEKQEGDRIYIAGSLYLAGQIKALIRRMPDD